MFRNLRQISPGGAIILMLVLINAIILKYSYAGEYNLYWLLFITVPLLITAIMLMKYELFFKPDINNRSIGRNLGRFSFYPSAYEMQKNIIKIPSHQGWPGYHWQTFPVMSRNDTEIELRVTVGNDQCMQPYSSSILNIDENSNRWRSKTISETLNISAREGNFAQGTGHSGIEPNLIHGGDLIWKIGKGYSKCADENNHFDMGKFRIGAQRPEVKMIELNVPAFANDLKCNTAFRSPEGMLLFLQSLREGSSGKPVGFCQTIKSKKEFYEICYSILKTGVVPDFITIEDDLKLATQKSLHRYSMPLFEAISFVSATIERYGLKDRIKIFVSGKFKTGFDILKALSLGADACYISTTMILKPYNSRVVQSGSKKSIIDRVPLQYQLTEEAEIKACMINFHRTAINETKQIMDACGFTKLDEISLSGFLGELSMSGFGTTDQLQIPGTTKKNYITTK